MFYDRTEAGRLLADKLAEYKNNCVVEVIPRGGVVVGAEIARILKVPVDLVLVRKLGHPSNTEYAVCAVTEIGEKCNEAGITVMDKGWLEDRKKEERQEIARRKEVYLKGRMGVDIKGKTVILVDDGVATGLTFLAAVDELRKREPAKIVAALPVMPAEFEESLKKIVEEIVCLNIDKYYLGAVGAYYTSFPQVTDEEVMRLMK